MGRKLMFILLGYVLLFGYIYSLDVEATLVSLDENTSLLPFNITSSNIYTQDVNTIEPFKIVSSALEVQQLSHLAIRIYSSTITKLNETHRKITTKFYVDSPSSVYCAIVPMYHNRFKYPYYPTSVTIDSSSIGATSIFMVSPGIHTINVVDNSSYPIFMFCYPSSAYSKVGLTILPFLQYNTLIGNTQRSITNFSYMYAFPIHILALTPYSLDNIVLPISIDTRTLIANGQLKSDCSDIAITLYNPTTDTEQDLPFWLDPATCNTPNTVIYVRLPIYSIDKDIILYIYYGSVYRVSVSDPLSTFYYFVRFATLDSINHVRIYQNNSYYDISSKGLEIHILDNGALVIYNK